MDQSNPPSQAVPSPVSASGPLAPPPWLDGMVEVVATAARLAIELDVESARTLLAAMPSRIMRDYWHAAEQAAKPAKLQVDPPPASSGSRLQGKAWADLSNEVFRRDGHRCRYCGVRVLNPRFLRALDRLLGNPAIRFVNNKGAAIEHGSLVLYAVADHVTPDRRGGPTTLENLVTACGPHNYAKMERTLNELGWPYPAPRLATPLGGWDGLECMIAPLQALAATKNREESL